eukprot:4416270-Ditylum_brightwellii.AAC.2
MEAHVSKKVSDWVVNEGGLGALNAYQETAFNQAISLDSTSHLVEATFGRDEFKVDVHAANMEAGKVGGKTR